MSSYTGAYAGAYRGAYNMSSGEGGSKPPTLPPPTVGLVLNLTPATDGRQRISDPNGDFSGIPQPAPTNIRTTTKTSSSISIAWDYSTSSHTGFRIQTQIIGSNPSWIDQGTVGKGVRSFSLSGIPPSTTTKFRVAATGTVDSAWVEHSDSTSEAVAPGDLAPARALIDIASPRPDSERSVDSLYSYTHSQIEYIRPVRVFGGRAPFTFGVTGPAGVAIEAKSPPINPNMTTWAIVTMPAGVSGAYTVTATDFDGVEASVTCTVVQDDTKFVFCDADAPGGGDGTIGSPLTGFDELGFGTISDNSYQGKIAVFEGGKDYPLVPSSFHNTPVGDWPRANINPLKPRAYIGKPGTGKWGMDFTNAYGGFWEQSSGGNGGDKPDLAFHNVDWKNGYIGMKIKWTNHRASFWDIDCHNFDGSLVSDSYSDLSNSTALAISSSRAPEFYQGFTDIRFWEVYGNAPGRQNSAGIMQYGGYKTTLDWVRVRPASEGGGRYEWGSMLFLKGSMRSYCTTSCFGWLGGYTPNRGAHFNIASLKYKDITEKGEEWWNPDDMVHITRYCGFGSTSQSDQSLSFSYFAAKGSEPDFELPNLQCGYRWVDRCTMWGGMQKFPSGIHNSDPPYKQECPSSDGVPAEGGVTLTGVALFSPETYKPYLILPNVVLSSDTLVFDYTNDDWTPYITPYEEDEYSRLKGDIRYKLGWEIQ